MRLRLTWLAIMVLALAACEGATTSPAAESSSPAAESPAAVDGETIKFGFFGPLTGPTSGAGQALQQGAQLKIQQINDAGGVLGRQIELISCDDKSVPEEAVKCAQRLTAQDGVVAIVGSLHSPHISATGPIVDAAQVPMVGAGTGPGWCQEGFEFVWRGTADSTQSTGALAEALEGSGIGKIGMLYQNDDYGIGGLTALKESLPDVEFVAEEAYTLGDRDWSGQIISILAAEPDAIAAWALGDDLGSLTNQIREQGWTGTIIGAEGYTLPQVIEVGGDNVEGVIFSQLYYIPAAAADYPDPKIGQFLEAYEAEFGALPVSDNAYRGADAVLILTTGMERAGTLEPEEVREAIATSSDIEGLAGTFDFAEGGCDGIRGSRVWTFADGAIVPFEGEWTEQDGLPFPVPAS